VRHTGNDGDRAAGARGAAAPGAPLVRLAAAAVLAGCSSAGQESAPTAGSGADGGAAVAVTSDCAPEPPAAGAAARVDSAYGVTYATRGGDALRLDAAWPRGGGPRPLVVLLHGGGWSGGSRGSLHGEMHALARRGYAAATVEYRLTRAPRNVFPAALDDVRCAVRFLREHAAAYGADPDRVAAAGYSAGAHLASMLGAGGAADTAGTGTGCASGGGDAPLRAVISYAGPQDLRVNGPYTREQAELVTNFLGAFPGDAPDLAARASPIAQLRAGGPPFLFVHGTDDPLVPVEHARRMAAALRRVGTPATVLELRGAGHGFVGLAASRDARVRCTTGAFLARWLGAPAGAPR
jgi:acetyl esterase/lipase